jgi:hypothetical protein
LTAVTVSADTPVSLDLNERMAQARQNLPWRQAGLVNWQVQDDRRAGRREPAAEPEAEAGQ